jgi:4-alpha-glucanotransferase
MLPVGPTGYGNSPYQLLSSFAGNPLLVRPALQRDAGLLDDDDLVDLPDDSDRVDFDAVRPVRMALLAKAFERFRDSEAAIDKPCRQWCDEHAWWLNDYCLFAAAKQAHGEQVWSDWDPALARREPAALKRWSEQLADAIEFERFVQIQFAQQWSALRSFARERGVRLIGDVPIYVAPGSVDQRAHPELFRDDAVAGTPPDAYTDKGQLWGNPLYDWPALQRRRYRWWTERFRRVFELFDLARIDHFRAFVAYWAVPKGARHALGGRWQRGPGRAPFVAAAAALGRDLPLIAENLGVITPPVERLRTDLGLPGMVVLQFGFDPDPRSVHRLENHPSDAIVYTGTHDNDTLRGWYETLDAATRAEVDAARDRGDEPHWSLIRLAFGSRARVAMVQLQDVLGLGSEGRMNQPGRASGAWKWRLDALPGREAARRLRAVTEEARRLD